MKKIKLICKTCKNSFFKKLYELEIDKSISDYFCSLHCSAVYNNQLRKESLETKQFNCKYCDLSFLKRPTSKKQVCDSCKIKRRKEYAEKCSIVNIERECIKCKTLIKCNKYSKRQYCKKCIHEYHVELGKKNGRLSVLAQQRRSKNEIYFAELCCKKYDTVSCNEQFFKSPSGNWDADVIIHKYKLAILWNGIWHYKQIRKNFSLKQIQSRDKIKLKIIKNNGYEPYVIKDMGKFNKKFVEDQFDILKIYINNLQISEVS